MLLPTKLEAAAKDNTNFDCTLCMKLLAASSGAWSFRDVDKVLGGVLSAVLGTERCRVTSALFVQELRNGVRDKEDAATPSP